MPREELEKISTPQIAESVMRVRDGKVRLSGGYDGVFGKIQIYSDEEKMKMFGKVKQPGLF
jgi:PHP family Zn ribbon phosphoesterase